MRACVRVEKERKRNIAIAVHEMKERSESRASTTALYKRNTCVRVVCVCVCAHAFVRS